VEFAGAETMGGNSFLFNAESVGLGRRKGEAGIAQTANKILIRALLFQDVFLLGGERAKKFAASHLIENIGIALVRADEERHFTELDRSSAGCQRAEAGENKDGGKLPGISFHGASLSKCHWF
jgi:hypothetical protein